MEAAASRAAARDRWNDFGRPAPSQLQRFIQSACSPENFEPNLALCLEIADLINSKKGTAPREAAIAIVAQVNSRNPNVALLALHLLDMCVKNCGYPFHLQISTKEFLNELVRRFPERPPVRPTRVQAKILEAIEEWRGTICETSKYKNDFGFIRDMHRLLSYKGYTFPEVRREDAAVLNPSDNLKSAEEMEEEEREAQSAKLQELIRRGGPQDLQEANRLMKVMAGYDTRSKTDYRAKAAEDVAKTQAKARLLEERLEAFRPGDAMKEGDVFEELASALQSAQPKIQKMCEEESEDHEAVAKLLEINDSIHRTVERYRLMKKGDLQGAATLASGAPMPTNKAGELSLIDFDADAETSTNNGAKPGLSATRQPGGLEDDLLGLSIGESAPMNYGQAGGIALGFGANTDIPGPALLSSVTQNNRAKPSPSPSPSPFQSFASPPASTSATPQPPLYQAFNSPQQPAAADPFASLIGAGPSSSSTPKPAAAGQTSAAAGADDDEWAFESALPPEPKEVKSVVSDTALRIEMVASRGAGPNAMTLHFSFSNTTAEKFSELHFQIAAPKGYELQLRPQTGRTLEPNQQAGVSQDVAVCHADARDRKVESLKLRWRVSYKAGSQQRNEMGEVPEFTLA